MYIHEIPDYIVLYRRREDGAIERKELLHHMFHNNQQMYEAVDYYLEDGWSHHWPEAKHT